MNPKADVTRICMYLLPSAVSITAHADIGKLTINGVEIPDNLIDGIYKNENWCPPTSDARYRDRLINTALIVFAGRDGNFQLDTSQKENLAEKRNDLRRAESGGNEAAIAKAAWKQFFSLKAVLMDPICISL